jgi:hypothetical protein
MCKIEDKNKIKEQFISSQAFHRTTGGHVREITAGEQFEPRILESFNPATQELYRHLPATIHAQHNHTKRIKSLPKIKQPHRTEHSAAYYSRTRAGRLLTETRNRAGNDGNRRINPCRSMQRKAAADYKTAAARDSRPSDQHKK